MNIEQRLEELGITLPESAEAKAMYVPAVRLGSALFVSGQVPFERGALKYAGKVGAEQTLESAQKAARLCAVNMLAVVRDAAGGLDRVKRVVKLQAFVSSVVGFSEQHLVANAASELLFDVFGERGRHARTAVGTNQLPLDATVEIEAIFEIEEA